MGAKQSWMHGPMDMFGPEHSNALERRLTTLEIHSGQQTKSGEKHETRIIRLERLMAGALVALSAIAHDQLPSWVKYASAALKAAMP